MEQPEQVRRLPGLPVRRLQQAVVLGCDAGRHPPIGGFDLLDMSDPEHAILNGVPIVHGGNAAEILAGPELMLRAGSVAALVVP